MSFFYPRQRKPALTEINVNFGKGGITALIGLNGSGKTTMTKLMSGILRPSAGEIRLQGRLLTGYSLAEIGRCLGYVFQNPSQQLICTTVAEEIGFGLINRGCEPEMIKEKVEFYLDYFELAPYRDVFPLHLSQGEKRRVALASILVNEPELLILDEPTVGLDVYRQKMLAECLRKIVLLKRGVIIVSHDMGFVLRVADRIINLEKGQIRWDSESERNVNYEA